MSAKGAQTVDRAFRLLRLIARNGIVGEKLTELAQGMGLPHSTVHRLLKALIAEGAVVQDCESRRYRLGPLPFQLGLSSWHSPRLVQRLRPALDRIAQATEDTVYLVMRSGYDAVCLDRVEARTPIRTASLEVGDWRPLGVGAAAIALLAALPPPEIESCLALNAKEFLRYGGLTVAMVRKRVESAQQDGFGFTSSNLTMGISAYGMAVPAQSSIPYLGISVASTTDRVIARTALIKSILLSEIGKIGEEAERISH